MELIKAQPRFICNFEELKVCVVQRPVGLDEELQETSDFCHCIEVNFSYGFNTYFLLHYTKMLSKSKVYWHSFRQCVLELKKSDIFRMNLHKSHTDVPAGTSN